ncbi:MAG: ectoine synthase [Betaproteobacteria bacterium]|jgi:L-ectoine synthase
MIVRDINDIDGTQDDVVTDTWRSKRIILKKDGMGYSVHETTIYAGTETHIWYQNHLESVFCIQGEGEVETIPDGKIYPIRPGVLYALNEHDNHYLRAKTEMKMICVFNPPLTGREVHDKDGVYPIVE